QAILIGRQRGIVELGEIYPVTVEIDEGGGWVSNQHLFAIKGIHADAVEMIAWLSELVDGHVITVRPNTKLAVVGKFRARRLKVVRVIRTSWIAILGNGDTLMEWRGLAGP